MIIHYSPVLTSFVDKKVMASETNDMNRESVESSITTTTNNNINAPKYGTVIPNRVFVGGISSSTTESDLIQLFSNYGHVVGTKIIADRAGVSKGYGFVTFETEEEAKHLQKDAENVVLRERRLNIAPAIRKQGFTRNLYEGVQAGPASPIPLQPNQVIRQNGVTFTFHNGMAFFPQQGMQPQPASPVTAVQNHVEPASVYATGNPYGGMSPANTPTPIPFSYIPSGQIFYAPHFQMPVPPVEGCYPVPEGHNGIMMQAQNSGEPGGVLFPTQYYLTQSSPQTELAYYPQSQMAPMLPPQENVSPIIYPPSRNYDQNSSSAIVYSEVPQFPFYPSGPRQFMTYSSPPPRRGVFFPRVNKYNGGRHNNRTKWYNRDSIIEGNGMEDGANCGVLADTLTPPITPRSPQEGNEATQTDNVLNSMETLNI